MAISPAPEQQWRLARRSFWALTLIAVAAAGSMSAALEAPPGALTGVRVAVSGLILVAASTLAARVMVILESARRRRGR